jgi:hypothetical protein
MPPSTREIWRALQATPPSQRGFDSPDALAPALLLVDGVDPDVKAEALLAATSEVAADAAHAKLLEWDDVDSLGYYLWVSSQLGALVESLREVLLTRYLELEQERRESNANG